MPARTLHASDAVQAREGAAGRVQAKLEVGRADDVYEHEADRMAEALVGSDPSAPPLTVEGIAPVPASAIRTAPRAVSGAAPATDGGVEEAVTAVRGGQPLPRSVRQVFEPRLRCDLGGVRVHADGEAAKVAQRLNARAFTVGRDIAFGSAQYAPETREGRRLLAHELVHVVQQRQAPALAAGTGPVEATPSGGPRMQRAFSPDELNEYLANVRALGRPVDELSSDDKAREIVEIWKWDPTRFRLTSHDKVLLIREMQSGFTGDDDERAILELLERSTDKELAEIFGPEGIEVEDLNSDFHGDEWVFLQDFYSRRFVGGLAALLEGKAKPVGKRLPKGTSLGLTWERRGLQEEQDEPSSRALAAVRHAEAMKRENIWFDSWGNDLRDNDLDGQVDGKSEQGLEDGRHYGAPFRARVCDDPDLTVSECDPSDRRDASVLYKVCIDVPLESYRAAGIAVPGGHWIPALTAWLEKHPEQWQVWRAPRSPSSLLPGDFVSVEGHEHQHSGIVGTGYLGGLLGSVINLPGPTSRRRAGWYEPSDLHDVMEIPMMLWKALLGFNVVARPRL